MACETIRTGSVSETPLACQSGGGRREEGGRCCLSLITNRFNLGPLSETISVTMTLHFCLLILTPRSCLYLATQIFLVIMFACDVRFLL